MSGAGEGRKRTRICRKQWKALALIKSFLQDLLLMDELKTLILLILSQYNHNITVIT